MEDSDDSEPQSRVSGGVYHALEQEEDERKEAEASRLASSAGHLDEEETTRCCPLLMAAQNEKPKQLSQRHTPLLTCLTFISISLALLVPALVEWDYRRALTLDVDLSDTKGPTYKAFTTNIKSSQPIEYSIYYFDLQNADDVLDNEATPVVAQRGPYVYDEYFEMYDISFSDGKKLMHFFERKYYVFRADKSCAGCDDSLDVITTIDLVAINILEVLADVMVTSSSQHPVLSEAVVALLCQTRGNISPFIKKTIRDAHWGSWGDPTLLAVEKVLTLANVSKPSFSTSHVPGFEGNYSTRAKVERLFGARDAVRTKGAKSMRYDRYCGSKFVRSCLSPTIPGNDSLRLQPACAPQDPTWDDVADGETMAAQNGWTLAYATRDASRVGGASPTFVKPLELNRGRFGRGLFYASPHRFAKFVRTAFASKDRTYRGDRNVHFFIDSVFRELKFARTKQDGDISRRGIRLERYQLDRGSQLYPGEINYDQFTTPYGILNLTRAVGFPLWASQPHFFDSDRSLQSNVVGLTPARELHNTYVDVEPRSGEVFAARERLQFNAVLFNYLLPGTGNDRTCALGSHGNWSKFPPRVIFDVEDLDSENDTVFAAAKNHDGFAMPIGYIDQGYDLSHADAKALAFDLRDVDALCDGFFVGFLTLALLFAICLAYSHLVSHSAAARENNKTSGDDLVDLNNNGDDDDDDKPEESTPYMSALGGSFEESSSCGGCCQCRCSVLRRCCSHSRRGGRTSTPSSSYNAHRSGGVNEGDLLHSATEPRPPYLDDDDDDDVGLPAGTRSSELV